MPPEGQHDEAPLATSQSPSPASSPPVPEEPYSIFDKRQKALIVFIVSTAATFSGFASNIYFPALSTIAADLNVSVELVILTVTSYLIFQALAPSLWGPISDAKGRRVAYTCTFLVFLAACLGLANTHSYATLLVLRCLQSTGSASTIAIGSGVIGDITTRHNRGSYMGVFQAGLLMPVAVGPVIGGALAAALGWRAIFWFLAIYAAAFLVVLLLLLPETLRSLVANGSRTPASPISKYPLAFYQRTTREPFNPSTSPPAAARKPIDLAAPLRILTSKHAAPIICFLALYYAVWQMSITAMSTLFRSRYGLDETEVGLIFIANGAGSIVGTLVTGKLLDGDYRRVVAAHQGESDDAAFPLEKARLRLVPVLAAVQCASVLLFGWSIDRSLHLAVPIVATFLIGFAAVAAQSAVMTYLVDVFETRSAAASASLNLARCLCAAGGTSAVMPLIGSIGVGWAFTVCVGVLVVGGVVGVGVVWRWGGRWRGEAVAKKAVVVAGERGGV